MNRLLNQCWIFAALIISSLTFVATTANAEPRMGQEFNKTAQMIPTEDPSKIEVVELFWYGCPHCHDMDPQLNAWVEKLPEDVVFKRIPGLPHPQWEPMAKAYYAMEDLGILEKYHTALFDAIHGDGGFKGLVRSDKAAIAWLSTISGLSEEKVKSAFYSFSMKNRLTQARNFFRASGATGVPSLIIDGQYITSSTMAHGNARALEVADYIIENIRRSKKAQ